MIDAPVAPAFTAGLVATINPCGFVMLPAYLSWFIETADDEAPPDVASRALYILDGAELQRRYGRAGLWLWRMGRFLRLRWRRR